MLILEFGIDVPLKIDRHAEISSNQGIKDLEKLEFIIFYSKIIMAGIVLKQNITFINRLI